jgi:outer membrane lipoprotein LolB
MALFKQIPSLRLLVIILVAFMSACSQTPELQVTQESEQKWDLRQQQLANINEWEIHARVAILLSAKRYKGLAGLNDLVNEPMENKVYPVGINWSRQNEYFSMVIEAPFGQGVIRIESNVSSDKNKQFKLTLADGKYSLGATPERLLINLLGWSIPVSGLKSWIKGLPQPNVESNYEIYGSGKLKSLRQNDWLINYLDYFSEENQAQQLPKRLYLKHDNMGMKIVIERWKNLEAAVEQESIFPNFD